MFRGMFGWGNVRGNNRGRGVVFGAVWMKDLAADYLRRMWYRVSADKELFFETQSRIKSVRIRQLH